MKLLLLVTLLPLVAYAWVDEMELNGLYEGDMVLNPGQLKEAMEGKLTYGSIKTGLWPKVGDHVTIPYQIGNTIRGSRKAMGALRGAFADYQKYTCIRFIPRTKQGMYLDFRDGRGCSSPVGATGGRNLVTLAKGCWSRSTVIHEVGHSMGLYHEQSRPDRDGFIKVRWENIQDNMKYNFDKASTTKVDSRGTPYDYRSVMHYGKTAFGDGKVTMQTTDAYFTDLIGIGAGFSDVDVQQINKMYGCPAYNGVVEEVKQTPECHDANSYCEMTVMDYGCGHSYNKKKCPFTCRLCTPGGGGPNTRPIPTRGHVETLPPRTYPPSCKDEWGTKYCDGMLLLGRCADPMTGYYCKRTCGLC